MEWHEDGAELECRIEMRDGTARIRPIGELDIGTVPFVEQCLDGVRAAAVEEVILDLSGTTFIDSAALHLTLAWQERARRERFTFALTRGTAAVRRVMEAAGVGPTLNFVE